MGKRRDGMAQVMGAHEAPDAGSYKDRVEEIRAQNRALALQPIYGDTRACPDCGRLQFYTGTGYGWTHDALADNWHCADLRKGECADRQLISHLTPGCTCDHRPGDPCNASCPVHLGAGLRRA